MFDDPVAKANRANENLDTLSGLIDAFARDAYTIDMEPDVGKADPKPSIPEVDIWVAASKSPPSIAWGPIIGDIVHGFRSSLDQLIWSLSLAHRAPSGPPADPIPRGDPWRKIGFPVCLSAGAWKRAVKVQLWAIDPALLAKLKPLQPFLTGKNAPEREPLAVLQELWNIDKHRHLHLTNATCELSDVLTGKSSFITPLPPGLKGPQAEVVWKATPGPLIGRTKVGRARLIPGDLLATTTPQMYVDPRVAVDVAFDQGSPAYGGRVLHTLRQIGQTVEAIIAAV